MNQTTKYYGRKSIKNLETTRRLLPGSPVFTYVDGCTGSCSVTINLFAGHCGAKKIAYDKDSGIITMLSAFKENPLEVAEAAKKIRYSKKDYARCGEILSASKRYTKAEVAAAEFAMIYMSRDGMAGKYQRLKPGGDKKEDEQQELYISRKMHEKITNVAIYLHYKLQNVELVCGDFMEHTRHWEDVHTFNYLDVPYPYSKRGIVNAAKCTGYKEDWGEEDHDRFLKKVLELYYAGRLRGKLMICSNFELDERGGLIGIKDDIYNKMLLKTGAFRLVVTEVKNACESRKNGERRRKAEVVWINYTDILGSWGGFQYFDKDTCMVI